MPYETEDFVHLENPECSEDDFRKTEAGKVNVVGTINLGRGIQARIALLKGSGDKTGIYVYLFYKKDPYSWTLGKATEWLQAHKQAAFSFDYEASVEVYDPAKHLAKILVIDTTANKNRWQVTDDALTCALGTLVGAPLIAYPDHSGIVKAGRFVDAQKVDGYAVGIAEITDPDAWEKISKGEWRFVSPKVIAYDVSKIGGVDLLGDFVFEHVAFVPQGAYPSAQVLSTYAGEESSPRSFSAALTERLEEVRTKTLEAGVIPYDPGTKADEGLSWSFNAADYDTSQLKRSCAWFDSANPDVKDSYKLPHHLPDGRVVWRGVATAMEALLGARGGVQIPSGDRQGVYNHLAKHYDQFGKTPPAYHADNPPEPNLKGEQWKMSEKAQNEELSEKIAEIAKMKASLEKMEKENAMLHEFVAGLQAKQHEAKVQELLDARARAGFTPTADSLNKFRAMSDDLLDQMLADAREYADQRSFAGAPKARYTGSAPLTTEQKTRLRLFGKTEAPKEA